MAEEDKIYIDRYIVGGILVVLLLYFSTFDAIFNDSPFLLVLYNGVFSK